MASKFNPVDTESNLPSPSSFINRRCCFCIPYKWQKVPSSSSSAHDSSFSNHSLWSRGVTALKKLREWSEIVAGPKWKTFIRRFNRNKSFNTKVSKFQYDPLDYKLNFDEGPLENNSGDLDGENEYMIRNFSTRYAARPATVSLKDIGPNFV